MAIRGVDDKTGEVVEYPGAAEIERLREENLELRERLELKERANEVLAKESRILASKLSKATGEENNKRENDPFWEDGVTVWEYYRQVLRPEMREFNDARWKSVRARLQRYKRDELLKAVDGYARMPTRVAPVGSGKWRNMTELSFIVRDEQHLRWGLEWAEIESVPTHSRDPLRDVRAAFETYAGIGVGPMPVVKADWVTAFCLNCSMHGRSGVMGLHREGRLFCNQGCSPRQIEETVLDWYKHSGLARCGACGQEIRG